MLDEQVDDECRKALASIVEAMLNASKNIIKNMKPDEEAFEACSRRKEKLEKIKRHLEDEKLEDEKLMQLKDELEELALQEQQLDKNVCIYA